ncbi:MAG: four helix bundle protein [Crocinitomicaceae bacterium]|nr:four helix bundle protein [Crocinitomicaceae bacterium]
MHNFRELNIWKKGMDLAKKVLSLTTSFPEEMKYGITAQINRCAISIPSNIAEGSARTTNRDFSGFLVIAMGSAYELKTQRILSWEINILTQSNRDSIINEF